MTSIKEIESNERGFSWLDVQEIRERLPKNAFNEISNMTRTPKHSVAQEFSYKKVRAPYRSDIIEAALYLIEREAEKSRVLLKRLNFSSKKIS